jgi:hypothetical protein
MYENSCRFGKTSEIVQALVREVGLRYDFASDDRGRPRERGWCPDLDDKAFGSYKRRSAEAGVAPCGAQTRSEALAIGTRVRRLEGRAEPV